MGRRLFVCMAVLGCLLLCWPGKVEAQGQISDPQAYFQWMLAVTDNTLTPRMAAHLSAAGLSEDEAAKAAKILQQFKAEEFGLEASYNNLPSVQVGRNDDTPEFYAKQEELVQRTITKLRLALLGDGFVRLDNRVQHEAKNIKISAVQHRHSELTPVSFGRPQRLGMTPNYTYYNTSAATITTVSLTASMLSDTFDGSIAFPQWDAANLVDNNTSDVGFSTDTSQAWKSSITIDLGSAQDVIGIGMYLSAANYAGQFEVWYSDNETSWTRAVTSASTPALAGWNYAGWQDAGAHRYWNIPLVNTPGSGPTINELQLILSSFNLYTTSQVTGTTSCPDGCPPLAKHVGWAQVVTSDGAVHNTYGPPVYPTSNINVSDNESTVLPVPSGDPPSTTSTTGGVNCTVAGNGFSGTPNVEMDIRFERAITESYISALLDSNGMHPEHIYCIIAATPPDFPGPDEALPGTSSGQVVNIAFLYREWPLGTKETGVPWNLVFPNVQRFGLGYYVVPTMEPDPSGCTMWDNGFRHLPLPTPLDPQPSSPW